MSEECCAREQHGQIGVRTPSRLLRREGSPGQGSHVVAPSPSRHGAMCFSRVNRGVMIQWAQSHGPEKWSGVDLPKSFRAPSGRTDGNASWWAAERLLLRVGFWCRCQQVAREGEGSLPLPPTEKPPFFGILSGSRCHGGRPWRTTPASAWLDYQSVR